MKNKLNAERENLGMPRIEEMSNKIGVDFPDLKNVLNNIEKEYPYRKLTDEIFEKELGFEKEICTPEQAGDDVGFYYWTYNLENNNDGSIYSDKLMSNTNLEAINGEYEVCLFPENLCKCKTVYDIKEALKVLKKYY